LHDEIVKAMNSPEVRKRLEAEGSEVVGSTPEQYGALIRRDIEKWAKVIKETGTRVE
jgi:tripartite-type tricarboxylate transporter receptor subunit TctC